MWRRWLFLALILLSVFGVSIIPAAAQSGVVWNGDYYNNPYLQAPSAFQRQDGAIAFDWGSGSPGTGINADNFSVRWGSDPFFQAGTYRFWVLADDNVKVTVDFGFTPLIDTFGAGKVGQVVSADITLTQGNHHIQVDYQELSGNAYVYVTWANLATNPTGPNFPSPIGSVPQPPVGGPWTAQYYANANLSGTPTLIQSEVTPTHDWGFGSPVASIPADNFSARWTSVQTLNAGTYQISVRADDGVRVVVDGVTYINEWHTATGATYTANVNLFAGQHTFMIEFFEAGGAAFLDYRFQAVGGTFPTPPVVTGASMTVTGAFRLNVRNAPSAQTGQILTRINRNETYPIVGRNSNSTWWQINVNGTIGWVNASYVTAVNTQNVPVTSGGSTSPTPPVVTGASMTVTGAFRLNVRNAPSAQTGQILTRINRNETYPIVGRNSNSTWWQINVNGTIGWVNASYVTAVNTQNVPVTSGGSTSVPPSNCFTAPAPRLVIGRMARVTPGLPNNIRSLPTTSSPLLGQIPTGGAFVVLGGPQCVEGFYWWQINYNGLVGWTPEGSNGQYFVEPL